MQRLSMLAGLAMLLLPTAAAAQISGCPRHTEFPGLPENVVYQEFNAPSGFATAWRVSYDHAPHRGLFLTSAWFRPGPDAPWVKFLDFAGLSDILVTSAAGGARYWALSQYGADLLPLTRQNVGLCARLISDSYVARDVRDAGVMWLNSQRSYRDTALLLWSNIDVANHNYIVAYAFHADGHIEFRLGATSVSPAGRAEAVQVHDGLWRVDVDLDGADGDSAVLARYVAADGSLAATPETAPFGGGSEGGAQWVGREFTTVRVQDDNLVNGGARQSALEFQPLYRGTSRHAEALSANDFWVTASKPDEVRYADLASYVDDESVESSDITVWLKTSILVQPTAEHGRCVGDEDSPGCGNGFWEGAAPVSWAGFDIRPRDLFDRTPFHRTGG